MDPIDEDAWGEGFKEESWYDELKENPRRSPLENNLNQSFDSNSSESSSNSRSTGASLPHASLPHDEAAETKKKLSYTRRKALFEFCRGEDNLACVQYLLKQVEVNGLRLSDPRLKPLMTYLDSINDQDDLNNLKLDFPSFSKSLDGCSQLINEAINKQLVIPDFQEFSSTIKGIFTECKKNNTGENANYIPQLARANPDHWGVSVCTVDGQRLCLGDSQQQFTIQSTSKPITYAMLLHHLGHKTVHKYEGCEPSGRTFNEIALDYKDKPHNPMVNSGAIMSSALLLQLVNPEFNTADKYDMVMNFFKDMAGGEYIGFDNAVYMSEKENADRNTALAFFMRENNCFPKGVSSRHDITAILEFYYQICSLKATCESLSVLAATLANGGKCPITSVQVINPSEVRHVLSLMYSCGMYHYSGQFAFNVGLPAKSGVSGVVMLVVPNVMGVVMYSPRIDTVGNSVRGVEFCERLVKKYNFHMFDSVDTSQHRKDPTEHENVYTDTMVSQVLFKSLPSNKGTMFALKQEQVNTNIMISHILNAATKGDLSALKNAHSANVDMDLCDYNGRTALHQAASQAHAACVNYLLKECKVDAVIKDKWGMTPSQEAIRSGHENIAKLIGQSNEHNHDHLAYIKKAC